MDQDDAVRIEYLIEDPIVADPKPQKLIVRTLNRFDKLARRAGICAETINRSLNTLAVRFGFALESSGRSSRELDAPGQSLEFALFVFRFTDSQPRVMPFRSSVRASLRSLTKAGAWPRIKSSASIPKGSTTATGFPRRVTRNASPAAALSTMSEA